MLLSFPHPSPPNPNPTAYPSKPKPKPTLLPFTTPTPASHLAPLHASTTTTTNNNRTSSSSPSPETLAKSAIRRISDKLRSLGYLEETAPGSNSGGGGGGAGEIFVPTPEEIPKYRVGSTLDPSWSTPEGSAAQPAEGGGGPTMARFRELWRRERGAERRSRREVAAAPAAPPSAAELVLPPRELRRLRGLGIRIDKRLKVGKAGVTEGIVNGIHERWRRSELVKIKCEDICRMNMKRTHEILERKTGGLVVWRSGSIIILYRGANYKYPYFHDREKGDEDLDVVSSEQSSSGEADEKLGVVTPELSSSGEEEAETLAASSSEQHITEKDHKLDMRSSRQISSGGSNEQYARLQQNTHVCTRSERDARARSSLVAGVGSPNKFRLQLPGEVKLMEEADKLLDGLGPRFSDWWGYNPLPVDADLLPAMIPGYRKPFRLLPFGIKPKLTDSEMTILRRLARPLPCHYALGRSRNLQGLAASMIKLWERCEVAKIAIKRGVQDADSELMTEELKKLTGGTLLSRDKEFIVFYRGKDFLPPAVSVAIEERRQHDSYKFDKPKLNNEESHPFRDASELKLVGEASNIKLASDSSGLKLASDASEIKLVSDASELKVGTESSKLTPASDASGPELASDASGPKLASDASGLKLASDTSENKLASAASENKLASAASELLPTLDPSLYEHEELEKETGATEKRPKSVNFAVQNVNDNLLQAIAEKERAEKLLEELENGEEHQKVGNYNDTISEEERYMLRKVGLRMKPFLLLGRRGVFDGTIENMHLHWKYRELVKILCKERRIEDVEYAARVLEAESGGILVAVERVSKGHMIIIYRGKNYQRPSTLRPKSLLNKRQALKRFKESQRHESLKLHVLNLSKNIDRLRHQMHVEDHPMPQSIQGNPDYQKEPMRGLCVKNIEEVDEVTSQHLNSRDGIHRSDETDGTLNSATDLTKIAVPSDNMQNKSVFGKFEDDCPESRSQYSTDDASSSYPHNRIEKSESQISSPMKCKSDDHGEDDSKDRGISSGLQPISNEVKLDDKPGIEFLFKPKPLSNQERLVLRKQALKMRKRPVLAVGRNNVVSGVAKTIKTHFKKHPLAIVNIKARAEGTPVLQLISELEEATGGVLVSREPNKVILYRGWGAEEAANRSKKNDASKREKEVISPQLMEAIRLECGLHSGEAE